MSYIILDLEWNQAFETKLRIRKPVYLMGEIIQIGAVKVSESGQYMDSFKIGVKPKYYTKMHKKVARLTGIQNEDLQYGFDFPVAFQHFTRWCGKEATFFTWGKEDMEILTENIRLHELPEMEYQAYDLQIIFDDQIGHLHRQIGLKDAVDMIGAKKTKEPRCLSGCTEYIRCLL